jgi:hypothetical protein
MKNFGSCVVFHLLFMFDIIRLCFLWLIMMMIMCIGKISNTFYRTGKCSPLDYVIVVVA